MASDIEGFYDDLAEHYHLIFEDWDRSIQGQAAVLGPLLEERLGPAPLRILDCACGVGTQAIGLALRGHSVVASDLSAAAVRRAEREASNRGVTMECHIADMRALASFDALSFDAIVVGDNSLPHLLVDEDLLQALQGMHRLLKPSGILLATMRDYDSLLETRPAVQGPTWFGEQGSRRIVHQVWDWDGDTYVVHLYLTWEAGATWIAKHYASQYRALRRAELASSLRDAGFHAPEYRMPEATGFYQPIVLARKQ